MTLTDFGINATATGWGPQWGGAETTDIPRMMREIAAVGATRVRIGLPWGWVQDKRDNYVWTDMDAAITPAVAAGLKPMICFDRIPGGADPEGFGELAQAAVTRYGDVVDEWEVFNEVNSAAYFPGVNALKYLDFLRAGYTAIHEIQPGATVIPAGLVAGCEDDVFSRTKSPVTFYRTFYENGGKDYFDQACMHLYFADANSKLLPINMDQIVIRHFEAIRALMVQYGDEDKKIYITEWGCEHVRPGVNGQRDRVAAQIPIMQHYRELGWLGPEFAFNIRDWKKKTDTKTSSHFGMLWMDDWSKKPVYYVWQGYAQQGLLPAGAAAAAMPVPEIGVYVDPNMIFGSGRGAAAMPVPEIGVAELMPSAGAAAAMPVPEITHLVKPTRIGVGPGQRNATANSTTISAVWDQNVTSPGPGSVIIAGFVVSHDQLRDWTYYDGISVTSDVDGPFTRVASRYLGASNIKNGSVHLFALWNPTVALHHLTANALDNSLGFTSFESIIGCSAFYVGVGGIANATSKGSGGSELSMTVPTPTDTIAVMCAGFNGAPGTFNKNILYTAGGSVPGHGDYMLLGDGAPAAGATSVPFTTDTNRSYGAVGITLTKIAA